MAAINARNAGFLEVTIMFLFFSGDDARGDRLWARLVIVMTSLSGDDHEQKQIPSFKDQKIHFLSFFLFIIDLMLWVNPMNCCAKVG